MGNCQDDDHVSNVGMVIWMWWAELGSRPKSYILISSCLTNIPQFCWLSNTGYLLYFFPIMLFFMKHNFVACPGYYSLVNSFSHLSCGSLYLLGCFSGPVTDYWCRASFSTVWLSHMISILSTPASYFSRILCPRIALITWCLWHYVCLLHTDRFHLSNYGTCDYTRTK